MKSATVRELRKELGERTYEELVHLTLHLAKFKKENKELLTYLLYEASDETSFIESVKLEIASEFSLINTTGVYYTKKSVRKILRGVKKYIRYSKVKQTEAELLICFCTQFLSKVPRLHSNVSLSSIYGRQKELAAKAISHLHEDIQYDLNEELSKLP